VIVLVDPSRVGYEDRLRLLEHLARRLGASKGCQGGDTKVLCRGHGRGSEEEAHYRDSESSSQMGALLRGVPQVEGEGRESSL